MSGTAYIICRSPHITALTAHQRCVLTGSRSSFNDVVSHDCLNCRISRLYRDAQAALERQGLSCKYLGAGKRVVVIVVIMIIVITGG